MSLRAYSRTICHVAPAFGCQLPRLVILELGMVALPLVGVLVGEELEPVRVERVSPIPRPTPNPIAIMARRSKAKTRKLLFFQNVPGFSSWDKYA